MTEEEIEKKVEEIEKKVEMEFRMRDFTKYINRVLREREIVEDWGFAVGVLDENFLEVSIDYYHRFHSRDVYDISIYDIDELKREFDFYFDKHLRELGGQDE